MDEPVSAASRTLAGITEAFIHRRISRRSFLRALTALGITEPAALILAGKAEARRLTLAGLRPFPYGDVYLAPAPTTAPMSTDVGCAEFASNFDGLGASSELIGYLSGCRVSVDGNWFLPTQSTDVRLQNGPILNEEEYQRTAELRGTLLSEVEAFMSEMDLIADPTIPSGSSPNRSFRDALEELRGSVKRVEFGYLRDTGSFPNEIALAYWRRLDPFLANPSNRDLAQYAYWWGQRRVSAVDTMCLQLAPAWCTSLENRFLQNPPWPWDLTDPFTMDEYLDWVLSHNGL